MGFGLAKSVALVGNGTGPSTDRNPTGVDTGTTGEQTYVSDHACGTTTKQATTSAVVNISH